MKNKENSNKSARQLPIIEHSLLNNTIYNGLVKYVPRDIEDAYNHLSTLEHELSSFISKMNKKSIRMRENIEIIEKTATMSDLDDNAMLEQLKAAKNNLSGFQKKYNKEIISPIKKKIQKTIDGIVKDIEKGIVDCPPAIDIIVKTIFIDDNKTARRVIVRHPDILSSVLWTYVLTKKIPSHFYFFADDQMLVTDAEGMSLWYDETPFRENQVLKTADEEDEWLKKEKDTRIPIKTYIPILLPWSEYPRYRIIRHPDICDVVCRTSSSSGYTNEISPEFVPYLLTYLYNLKKEKILDVRVEMD